MSNKYINDLGGEGKTRVIGEKPDQNRVENQQTQPTNDAESGY